MGAQWRYLFREMLKRKDNRVFIPVIIIILILLIYSLSSILITAPNKPHLSIYSDTWGDLSSCRNAVKNKNYSVSSIISTPTVLTKFDEKKYENMLYLAIGVERPYSKDDANGLWGFLQKGGNIVIADDFGYGNSFWDSDYSASSGKAEFKKHQLFDPNYIKNTTFVTIFATLPGPGKWYNLLLNEPTALERSYGTSDITTLGASSDESWLDENNNNVRDPREPRGSYPIIMYISLAANAGKLFVISDPGLFINENWNKLDNSEYVLDLVQYLLPEGGQVIFDESRHISDNTFENTRRTIYSGLVFMTSTPVAIIVIITIIVIFTVIIGVKIKPQKPWKNVSLLGNRYFNVLKYPYITPNDFWQIYNVFLEKVRLSYDFSPLEFKDLDEGTLYKLIGDDHLWNFIIGRFPYYMDSRYYAFIIELVLSWKPKIPDELDETLEDNIDFQPELDYYEEPDIYHEHQNGYREESVTSFKPVRLGEFLKEVEEEDMKGNHEDNANSTKRFDRREWRD